MRINANTKIYGLVGYPVSHSLSPSMQNAAFLYHKIDAAYVTFSIEPKDIDTALRGLCSAGIAGLNVTIPHKESAFRIVDEVDEAARLIGAVNTVLVKKGRLFGYNTDAPGFLAAIKEELKFNPKGKSVAVLGAGGAGRAVSFACAKSGASALSIYDVDKNRASALADNINNAFKKKIARPVSDIKLLDLKKTGLLVNASPVGMDGGMPVSAGMLRRDLAVYDLVYNRATNLVKSAKRKGAKAANGLGMLLHQGALAFSIWTGKKPPVYIMRKALEGALKKR